MKRYLVVLDYDTGIRTCIAKGGVDNYSYTYVVPDDVKRRHDIHFTKHQIKRLCNSHFVKVQPLSKSKILNSVQPL